MEKLSAEQAIEKIKSEKTIFMGVVVPAHNYGHEIRSELTKMSERNEISPTEYWKALKLTPKPESESLEKYEIEKINNELEAI